MGFIQEICAKVVFGIDDSLFETVLDNAKNSQGVKMDGDLKKMRHHFAVLYLNTWISLLKYHGTTLTAVISFVM